MTMHQGYTLDLEDCRRLVAIAEHGSFAAAARALGLSQPALTRAVQALEGRLRAAVFLRTSTGVQPTDVGLFIIERARELVARADELADALRHVRGEETGMVQLAIGPYPAAMILEDALLRLMRAAPGVQVQVFVGDWAEVLLRVRSGQADLGVMETSLSEDDATLEVTPLFPHEAHWVVRRGHPLDTGAPASLADVLRHRLAMPARLPPRVLEPLMRQRPGGRASANGLATLTCPDVALALRLIRQLDLVMPMPRLLVAEALLAGELAAVGREPWMHTQYGVVRPRRREQPRAASMLAEALVQADRQFAASAAALAARLKP